MSKAVLSKKIRVSLSIIDKYIKEFISLGEIYPEQALNVNFFPPKPKKVYPPSQIFVEMKAVLPALIANLTVNKASVPALFDSYREICPNGYGYDTFRKRFATWHKSSNICLFAHKKVTVILDEDKALLNKWLEGNDLIAWRQATVITDSYNGVHVKKIAEKVQLSYPSILTYITKYNDGGLVNLKRKYGGANKHWVKSREEKKKNLMKLIHQSPQLYGINRSSWCLADLSLVYYDLYGVNVAPTSIALYFKQEGIAYRKAKVILTSPDPKFREKLDHIKSILSNLGPNERFFSIDEYGPFSIKMKPGWSYTESDHPKTVKQFQKSKGWAICTAALELSTNQVTHFYSRKKDTEEMIKLIDLLIIQYTSDKKLYISWDAASWHSSSKLKEYLQQINETADKNLNITPYVELSPLPTSAQFLNVIESVFSGLARAVMHNSNYQSVDECKMAITKYFDERNAYFKRFPKRAGKMIWRSELVKSVFDESNNCKDPLNTL
ncbi:IS630 family transposase [Mucilaginibacter sp. McL0603]|uniref:IS630 family transposase n=1 Tax=Mucilaginibacter sp. McL0603 TaxID=3415670 RepID=UPI003CE91331